MLKESLVFWNPWWDGNRAFYDDIKDRKTSHEMNAFFQRKEVLALTGVRRSGKTSLMQLAIKNLLDEVDPGQILYVNLEDPALEDSNLASIYEAYEELMTPSNKRFLFLDEVQNKPGWEKWVKKLYDSTFKVKISVTGSNSSLLKSEYATALSGRSLTFEVNPLSFSEYLDFNGIQVNTAAQILEKKAIVMNNLERYLKFGGYPEVTLENDETMKFILLKEYFQAILSRDILTRYAIRNRKKLEKLAHYLVTNSSNQISAKSLSNIVDLNIKTVQEYIGHLEDVYLFFFVNHFSYSLKAQMTHPRKVYCVDTGLRNATSFSFSKDAGRLMENLVYLKLRREGDVYYWKDRNADIDFVLKKGSKVTQLVQSCYDITDEKTKDREIDSLLKAMDNFKKKSGTIVTWNKEDTEKIDGKTIHFKPLWKWLLA